MSPLFIAIGAAVLSFALQMLGAWFLWSIKRDHQSRDKELIILRADLRDLNKRHSDLQTNHLRLQTSHDNVVLYLKMKNGDIAREVL